MQITLSKLLMPTATESLLPFCHVPYNDQRQTSPDSPLLFVVTVTRTVISFHIVTGFGERIGAGLRYVCDVVHQTANPGHAPLTVTKFLEGWATGHHDRTNTASATTHWTLWLLCRLRLRRCTGQN